jgi:hypothetical protein
MEALSTLTIGNNAMRVRVQGTQERSVAAVVTAQAGCTPVQGEALGECEAYSWHRLVAPVIGQEER